MSISKGFILGVFLSLLWCNTGVADIRLPQNLNSADRINVVKILGIGTSTKFLSNPYSLGGFEGFQVSYSIESLPTRELASLGDGVSPQESVSVGKFGIGKGIYNEIDTFFHFTPMARSNHISEFGGLLRWGVLQATFIPANFSVMVHGNSATFANQITTTTWGMDFQLGVSVSYISFFVGLGYVKAWGKFRNTSSTPLTDSLKNETETTTSPHSTIGANLQVGKFFLALAFDRYLLTTINSKIGYNF